MTSVLWDQQYTFGVRSLLMVEQVLMINNLAMQPAISHQHRFFSLGIHKLIDSQDKCLDE